MSRIVVEADAVQVQALCVATLGEEKGEAETKALLELAESGKALVLVQRLLAHTETLLAKPVPAEDVQAGQQLRADKEGAVNIVATFIAKVPSDEVEGILGKLVAAVVADTSAPRDRMSMLLNVFALAQAQGAVGGYMVFLAMLRYAVATKTLSTVAGLSRRLSLQSDAWTMTTEQKRELYQAVVQLFDAAGDVAAAASARLSLAATFQTKDAGAADAVNQAVVAVLNQPEVYAFDHVTSLPALGAAAAPLRATLACFDTEQPLAEYSKVRATSAAALDALHLDHAVLEGKARIATLVAVCAAASPGELSYADVGKAVGVPDTEVEGLVIAGVSTGLMSARLHQPRKIVSVQSAVPRAPVTDAEWTAMGKRLQAWQEQVLSLLETVEASIASSGGATTTTPAAAAAATASSS